ncbi:MAG: hypothetical protein RLY20_293 [Verrucomicrobiota bacterium]|jgi:hypothetical protein
MMRPGISNDMLARAGVRSVNADEAMGLCNLAEPGLWLPYRDADGNAVRDGVTTYGRLRLDTPQGKKKYHQAAGTTVHAYLPPGLNDFKETGGDLYLIEGEFKSLSLTEAGFPAVGISGFYGFVLPDSDELVPELAAVIARRQPQRILFCGDSDTAMNFHFAHAAARLANLVKPLPVLLPRIPTSGFGKGADDCRAQLNGTFESWWRERVDIAVAVTPETTAGRLAVGLFEAEAESLATLKGTARLELEERVVKLAAALPKPATLQERVLAVATKQLGMGRRGLLRAVKELQDQRRQQTDPKPIDAFYDPAKRCYWIPNDRGEMIEVSETSMTRHLISAGFLNDKNHGVTQLDEELIRLQRTRDVVYAGPLAGHSVGLQEQCGQRILVTRPARLLLPVAGDSPAIQQLICDLFDDPDHPEIEQIPYVLGWLKVAYESLLNQQLRPGQALAIAGPRDCGKSLLQALITEIFGGRSAKPYRYMSGATEFNGDLFGAEHLMIEDEVAFTDIRARRHFGARIKDFTVNATQSCHGKNRPALSLKPFWRMSITLNDEPENLLILPPIDDSLEDKIILLKAKKAGLPADIGTADGRARYWAQLMQELPMFLDTLMQFQIPATLQSGRFGVKHFQHPTLITALSEMSPEMRLMGLIDAALAEHEHIGKWTGTATELERLLSESKIGFEARRLLDWNNATGTYLGRLAKKLPNRVHGQRTNTSRQWTVYPSNWVWSGTESVEAKAA